MRFGLDYSADVFKVDRGRQYMGNLLVLVGLQVRKPSVWCQSRQRRVSDLRRLGGKSLAFFFRGLILRVYSRELWIFERKICALVCKNEAFPELFKNLFKNQK